MNRSAAWLQGRVSTRRRRRLVIILVCLPVFLCLLIQLGIEIAISAWPFDPEKVDRRLNSHATLIVGRNGEVLMGRVSPDGYWRLPVSLHSMGTNVIKATLHTEDRRFFSHSGVDWQAAGRATMQLLRHRRIISGASTVSMQLSRLVYPEPRSLMAKVRQCVRAIHLERRRSKSWILESYMNLLPYGGNIEGVETAARYYFNRPADELSITEAALLAAIPQSPNRLRPDRFPQQSRKRQQLILEQLADAGELPAHLSPSDVQLYHRDRYFPDPLSDHMRFPVPFFVPELLTLSGSGDLRTASGAPAPALAISRTPPFPWKIQCPLDGRIQAGILRSVSLHQREMDSQRIKRDRAIVVVENATGTVRGLYGEVDPGAPRGFVNTVTARRSPGSALKPWIYLVALRKGLIVPETILSDNWDSPDEARLPETAWRPGNFDGRENGRVTARDALAWSLNIPAVRLLAQIRTASMVGALKDYQVVDQLFDTGDYGLSLALGSYEVPPLALAGGYARLYRTAVGSASVPAAEKYAARMVLEMLSSRSFPGWYESAVAWKTGTSNGHRDAWCVAVTRDWTVCIWVGHKSGATDSGLTGQSMAQPLAALVLGELDSPSSDRLFDLPLADSEFPEVQLCRISGLRLTGTCPHDQSFRGYRSPDAPLRWCTLHSQSNSDTDSAVEHSRKPAPSTIRIESPAEGQYFTHQNSECITFQPAPMAADKPAQLYWFLNGEWAGVSSGSEPLKLHLHPGAYSVSCVSDDGRVAAPVQFSIRHLDSR